MSSAPPDLSTVQYCPQCADARIMGKDTQHSTKGIVEGGQLFIDCEKQCDELSWWSIRVHIQLRGKLARA